MKGWCRVIFLAALAASGCAAPAAPGEDLGPGTGGNAALDLATTKPPPPPADLATPHVAADLALFCGDGVCSAGDGESCSTCPEDCGACPACAPGTADCNHDPSDGCETNTTTASNCGACGRVCQQAGGTNSCVDSAGTWLCQPTCDSTHGDCDGNPIDGCETDITTTANCGGCGFACTNPHGNTSCATDGKGYLCSPTCSSGWAACDAASAGCDTEVDNSPTHCGSCTRGCSSANASAESCSAGLCKPTCNYPYADCSDPAAPNADDGCETNGTVDSGENDNACSGQYSDHTEGSTQTISTNRILPSGDVDTFEVYFTEGSHTCVPFTGQSYDMRIDLVAPAGADLRMRYNDGGSCTNSWTDPAATSICHAWSGTCGLTDDLDFFIQVYGNNGANSCTNYQLVVTFATEGNKVAGCP